MEIDLAETRLVDRKLHNYLHSGLTRLNPLEKAEVIGLLRHMLAFLENS